MSVVPSEMKAVEIASPGGPEQLRIAVRPVPKPGVEEVLIRVAAAGVNRPDVMQRQGRYPPPAGASDIPGMEVAGEIVSLGAGVAGLAVGDQVTSLLSAGGYAEFAVAAAPLDGRAPGVAGVVEPRAARCGLVAFRALYVPRTRCHPRHSAGLAFPGAVGGREPC